jgi:hypothetical protein
MLKLHAFFAANPTSKACLAESPYMCKTDLFHILKRNAANVALHILRATGMDGCTAAFKKGSQISTLEGLS